MARSYLGGSAMGMFWNGWFGIQRGVGWICYGEGLAMARSYLGDSAMGFEEMSICQEWLSQYLQRCWVDMLWRRFGNGQGGDGQFRWQWYGYVLEWLECYLERCWKDGVYAIEKGRGEERRGEGQVQGMAGLLFREVLRGQMEVLVRTTKKYYTCTYNNYYYVIQHYICNYGHRD